MGKGLLIENIYCVSLKFNLLFRGTSSEGFLVLGNGFSEERRKLNNFPVLIFNYRVIAVMRKAQLFGTRNLTEGLLDETRKQSI